MKQRQIAAHHLREAAKSAGLAILQDAGGYRVVEETDAGYNHVFPTTGEAASESKRACLGFLQGALWQKQQPPVTVSGGASPQPA